MRYRLQRHDGTDCSATMVPITVLRMVPIQRYRHQLMKKRRSKHKYQQSHHHIEVHFVVEQKQVGGSEEKSGIQHQHHRQYHRHICLVE